MSIYIIYETLCLVNLKIYVGQHNTSADDGYLGSGLKIQNAIKKYGKENFERTTIEFCTSANVNEREIFWIDKLSAIDRNIGYNIAKGGGFLGITGIIRFGENNPNFGKKWTDKQKRIASERMKGRYNGENNPNFGNGDKIAGDKNPAKRKEVKEKISKMLKGKKKSEESKIKNRISHLGKKALEESKKKMSISSRWRKKI